ncbi:MAG: hypothetical protein IJ226_02460, partial [Clostridia bacterium]|nr:hypothetical protein [Clostridia bacterium]
PTRVYYSLRGHQVGALKSGFLYSLPLRLWDAPQQNVPKSRTECRPRHSGDSAIAESVPSSNE